MKRRGGRTRTLGLAWEEHFLAAVAKAREKKLIGEGEAERLRRLGGAYFCVSCKKEHRTESTTGRKHLRLQPALVVPDAAPRKRPLPVKLTAQAKANGQRARAKLTRKSDGPARPPAPPKKARKRA